MKNIFLCILLLACAVLPQLVQAQGINASPNGDACPNSNYTYTYTGSATGCNWVVKGAYTLVSKNSSAITVSWSDVPTDATSNPTSVSMDCGNGSPTTRAVFVSSISDKTPGPLSINGTQVSNYTLPFGDITTLTLYVPLVAIPNTTNAQYSALTYEWVIPSGWKYNDGSNVVSDGISTHRVTYNSNSGQAGNQLSVISGAGNGGTIGVRAINNNCVGASAGPVNSTSQQYSILSTLIAVLPNSLSSAIKARTAATSRCFAATRATITFAVII